MHQPSTTTSSSSAPARAAARSPTSSPLAASGSCCSSAAATCRASPRTGTRRRSSARTATSPRRSGTTRTASASGPHAQYYVGGNTKFYGAILFRLRERDFGEVQHYGGVSPAWPISYDDLEPYYAEAERLYLVHGAAGEDHTEPPRSGPFPYPAVSHEPRIQQLARRLRADRPPPVPPAGRRRHERVRPGAGPLRALRPLRRLPLPHRRQGRRARAAACARRSSTTTSR